MDINVRELALDTLIMVERDEMGYKDALNGMLKKVQYISKQDRAFLTKLVNGTVEYKLRLEYIINQYSNTPINKCKPLIRALLKMSLYQVFFLDSIPDSAAINEAVKLAKKRGFSRLSGFVNGVLRNVARDKNNIKYPDKDTNEYMSVYYSIPLWIVDMWVEQYDYETAFAMATALTKEPNLYAYVNPARCSKTELKGKLKNQGVKVYDVEVKAEHIKSDVQTAFADNISDALIEQYNANAIRIGEIDYLTRYESFKEGLFTIQDLSSMLVNYLAENIIMELEGGVNVLDMCSAPGSKALYIALCDVDRVNVTSRDISEFKTELISENADRLGADNIEIEVKDATEFIKTDECSKDIVILDAPCSGLGVLRRKKDIRYNMTFEQTKELAAIQEQMISNAASYVKRGRYLIYSTCTTNKEENVAQIKHFLEKHMDYELLYEKQLLIGEELSLSDGFFVAVLIRR